MILPPQGLNGASGLPITIRALNDGKVLIKGGVARPPSCFTTTTGSSSRESTPAAPARPLWDLARQQ